jgi:hypothetical protein
MSINRCDLCYEYLLDACQDSYYLNLNLDEDGTVMVVTEDNHGHIYTTTQTPDENGGVTLTASNFPAGMFNPYSGSYTLTVNIDGEFDGTPIEMMPNGEGPYECIKLIFKDVTVVNV